MAKKKDATPSICSWCHEPMPLGDVMQAFYAGYEYVHTCGRVVVKGSENAEVPIANHLDLSSPNPDSSTDDGGT